MCACIRFSHAELGSLNRISKFTWSLSTQIVSQNRELENHSEFREKENTVDKITKSKVTREYADDLNTVPTVAGQI